jgi:hypothetical protein
MDAAFFWDIIDTAFLKGAFNNKVKEQVIMDRLIQLTPEQIQEFEIIFQEMNKQASTWELYAAQTIIEGGSSDDRFFYFRCWIISLGKTNFDRAISNPDHLASLDLSSLNPRGYYYCQFEELISMSDRAYEIVTQKDPDTDLSFPRAVATERGLFYDSNTDMSGTEWKSNEELSGIAPLLYKKYNDQ